MDAMIVLNSQTATLTHETTHTNRAFHNSSQAFLFSLLCGNDDCYSRLVVAFCNNCFFRQFLV